MIALNIKYLFLFRKIEGSQIHTVLLSP